MTQCRPRWAPSIHRSVSGKKSDHALLECIWKWRMRLVKVEPKPDFSVLRGDVINKQGHKVPNAYAQDFQEEVRKKLVSLDFGNDETTASM